MEKEITKTISYKLQFIYSAKFMVSSLSNLFDNLSERIHKIKCKYRYYNKKCKSSAIKYKDCECCLEYTNIKDDLILYKCLCFNRNCQKMFYGNLRDLLIHTNVLSMTPIVLCYCCKKVFTYTDDARMIGKNSMKHHYQRKKIFTVT